MYVEVRVNYLVDDCQCTKGITVEENRSRSVLKYVAD